jgi:hypothetical protein
MPIIAIMLASGVPIQKEVFGLKNERASMVELFAREAKTTLKQKET